MRRVPVLLSLVILFLAIILVSGCAPAATQAPQATSAPAAVEKATSAAASKPVLPTGAPLPTALPQATQPPPLATASASGQATQPPKPVITSTPEERVVEMEWPASLHLGESDLVRLALIPFEGGYKAEAEFPEHTLQTQTVPVERPEGYDLYAVARLDGVGFNISPDATQERLVPPGQAVSWRWTMSPRAPGQQRLSVSLVLRWVPRPGVSGPQKEALVYARGLDVQVLSVLGLSRAQAMTTGVFGLMLGGCLMLFALVFRVRSPRAVVQTRPEGADLILEPRPGMQLSPAEKSLLRALFSRYARLVLQNEFLSGYSGARTFLALPIRPDGRSDAHTIVKMGPIETIRAEYENYESYVKDSLPPITARIQHAPVTIHGSDRAALQYTFIAEPGRLPVSLRQTLLENPDPALILKLFETFGPNWWMQRQPHVFRLGMEYDRLLPPHVALEPISGRQRPGLTLDERTSPGELHLETGVLVNVTRFKIWERRFDGQSLTLRGTPSQGQPALRLRWLSLNPPENSTARVVATRPMLLRDLVRGFDLSGLPDPLENLPDWLEETVHGTKSIIHGDLNLENVLVGPGGFVWMIDFAQTRQGHTLFDFAHLKAELVAQILAVQANNPTEFLDLLRTGHPLLKAVDDVAYRCLFNVAEEREFHLAYVLACLGALKFNNLDTKARQMLYLAAAWWGRLL